MPTKQRKIFQLFGCAWWCLVCRDALVYVFFKCIPFWQHIPMLHMYIGNLNITLAYCTTFLLQCGWSKYVTAERMRLLRFIDSQRLFAAVDLSLKPAAASGGTTSICCLLGWGQKLCKMAYAHMPAHGEPLLRLCLIAVGLFHPLRLCNCQALHCISFLTWPCTVPTCCAWPVSMCSGKTRGTW